MASKNRETLKNYFKKGGFATEKEFSDLIDSSMNLIDDGISIAVTLEQQEKAKSPI